jgi:C4-type Zn-finger protein
MDYVCPVCGEKMERSLKHVIPHTEKHIVDEIKKKHPKWAHKDPLCGKCLDYYKKQLNKK